MLVSCGGRDGGSSGVIPSSDDDAVVMVRLDLAADSLVRGEDAELARSGAFGMWMSMTGDTLSSSPTAFASTRRIAAFLPDVKAAFPPPCDSVASALGRVFAATGRQRSVYAVVSPFRQSVVLAGDTAVFIALNHYLGSGHPAYSGFPAYQRRQKTPSRIPLDVAEAVLAASYPYVPPKADVGGATALSRMLYEGALIELVMRATGVSEQEALGWTPDELRWAAANERRVWDEMLRRRLLFSTDPAVGTRLLDPAPSVPLVNASSPGRIGRFMGRRIVDSWLRATGSAPSADRLLSPEFYNSRQTLGEAGYNPR